VTTEQFFLGGVIKDPTNGSPVGFPNLRWVSDLHVYAARRYSLMRPPAL
jgi:hypothetical protein